MLHLQKIHWTQTAGNLLTCVTIWSYIFSYYVREVMATYSHQRKSESLFQHWQLNHFRVRHFLFHRNHKWLSNCKKKNIENVKILLSNLVHVHVFQDFIILLPFRCLISSFLSACRSNQLFPKGDSILSS